MLRRALIAAAFLLLAGCASKPGPAASPLTIAAASNLTGVMDEIAAAFQAETHQTAVISYGSTAQLSLQIEHGAPYDLFAAADTEHVNQLNAKGLTLTGTEAIYAQGRLALWIPKAPSSTPPPLAFLNQPDIRFIAVAQPQFAPYGAAAVEALTNARLLPALKSKLVYASNINATRQLAATGNADAAFTAYSLVRTSEGGILLIDPKLYTPLDQSAAIIASTKQPAQARRFLAFLTGPHGRKILTGSGYLTPAP